jgi:copper homeostasis protein
MVRVEVCADTVGDALAAGRAGARRVELCAELSAGGLTPSAGALAELRARSPLEIVVLIRPRGGDFVYGSDELAVMRRDLLLAQELGANGVALGALRADWTLAREELARLVELARPLPATLHRCFDLTRDLDEALEAAVELGFARVLSSGGAESAWAGRARLAALAARAAGRIAVVAAGGIRSQHARELVAHCGVDEIHLSARARTRAAAPEELRARAAAVRLGRVAHAEELEAWRTDPAEVRRVLEALR